MHILIVDDEPMIRSGLSAMVGRYRRAPVSVRLADNGTSALRQVAQLVPDLLFTDIRMPVMDGLELCERLHQEHPYIRVVVISGFADFEYAQQCIRYGVKEYLIKPVVKVDIHQLLDKYWKEAGQDTVSFSKSEEWIEEMAALIWLLKAEEAEQSLLRWKQYSLVCMQTPSQMKAWLEGCLDALIKRLQEKGEPIKTVYPGLDGRTPEEVFADFDSQVRLLMEQLFQRRSGSQKDLLEEAKSFIDRNLSRDLTLDEVAEMVGLTPTYFSHLFKKLTGETFVQYRIRKRIDMAIKLLAVPHYRIVDIALEVGYEDYPHFTKTFRKLVGYSPAEYRQLLGVK